MALALKSEKPAKEATPKSTEAEKAVATATAEAPVSAETDVEWGAKSDTIHFLRSIGDPTKDDSDYPKVNGKVEKITIPTKVGYVFKCTEDIEIPDIDLGEKFTHANQMSYKEDTLGRTRKVKAGEEFFLTKLETGVLLSRPEYNGCATGGQYPVSVVYSQTGMNASNGQKLQTAEAVLPKVSLKVRGSWGSINRLPIDPIMTFEKTVGKGNQSRYINKKIIPGFEKFEILCKTTQRRTAGTAVAATNARNKSAAAFLSIFEKKKGAK